MNIRYAIAKAKSIAGRYQAKAEATRHPGPGINDVSIFEARRYQELADVLYKLIDVASEYLYEHDKE